jgi:hypothetical protein
MTPRQKSELDGLTRRGWTYSKLGKYSSRAHTAVFAVYCGMVGDWNLREEREIQKEKRAQEKLSKAFHLSVDDISQILSNPLPWLGGPLPISMLPSAPRPPNG